MLNNDPRLGGSRWSFFRRTRHPPNSGLLPALSASLQLLVWPLKLSSCDLSSSLAAALERNRVLIQSVIFTLVCQEARDEL
ncbi:hypothetical protein PBY51_002510 [Eleginops maclovinus]|uniref:Uncharacterized protein n=1 Tax=Eleginops maclovinus TaxID=56733 RepID=A0AAN7XDT9_ELEMC|nr:hypothetical protein PBY51_002510 [Eleginops maclovinus]